MLGYRNGYLLTHPWLFFSQLWAEVRQLVGRHVRGYGWRDVASADVAIAAFALPIVRRLREFNGSTPGSFLGDREDTQENWDAANAEWCAVMDEIIWALDYIAGEDERRPLKHDEWLAAEARCDAGLALFGRYFRALWT